MNVDNLVDRQVIAEKVSFVDGFAIIKVGNTITLNGENFGWNYYIEAVVHGMESITGKTQSFKLNRADTQFSTDGTRTSDAPGLPGFELPISTLTIISIVALSQFKRKRKY